MRPPIRTSSPVSTSTTCSKRRLRSSLPTPRDDDGHRPAEALERGKVKVIVVEVGDEDPVESVEHPSVCRFCTPEVRHAVAEYRVGQYPRVV